MNRLALALAFSFTAIAPAFADCDHFKWSVADERMWFGSPTALPPSTGEVAAGKGYNLSLSKDVKLPVEPERNPKAGTYAAVLTVPKLEAGNYHITLSAEAWIDVGQNGALVKSSGFSGQKDCPGVRKSVNFNLAAGPATIEISNADADSIMFAIAPAK